MASVIRGDDNFDSAGLSLAPLYNSGELNFASGITTVSHGLGRIPYFWRVALRCKVANIGYSVGDEVYLGSMVDGDGARGYVSWANSSQINYSIDDTNIQNTNADYVGTNVTYWRLVFYAW